MSQLNPKLTTGHGPSTDADPWRVRRGTPGDDHYAAPPSQCWILDAPDHGHFAQVIARMQTADEDNKRCMELVATAAAAPAMKAALAEINTIIYANNIQLGSEEYFRIRQLCCDMARLTEVK